MDTRISVAEAEAQGFTIDRHCYPWLGYKGPRFRPSEQIECFTDTELALLDAARETLPQAEGCWANHYGDNPEGSAVPAHIQKIRDAIAKATGADRIGPPMRQCLKQRTHCIIIRADGRRYEASNECAVDGLDVCPRITARCKTGTGYELCGSTHAEANVAKLAAESSDVQGEAYLTGHTWMCKPCQDALRAVNVHTFHIEQPIPAK